MLAVILFIAEVGDKVPRLPVVFLWSGAITLFAWILARQKKWFAMLALPFAILFGIAATAEPRDPFVGPDIIREFGYSYPLLAYLAAVIPLFAIVFFMFRRTKNA